MNISALDIEKVVKKVIEGIDMQEEKNCVDCVDGIFENMDDAVEAAFIAQREYMKCTMADRDRFIKAIRAEFSNEELIELISRMSVDETGMGEVEYKIIKNKLVIEKTPGIEDLKSEAISGDDGLTLVELSPFGVIGAIAPTLRKVGAPENLVVSVAEPSIENTNKMINHDKVKLLVATGGPGIVKLVLSSGKKAIGAGAGNPPAVVDETADIEKAAKDIIDGCSFDNNLPCIAEKEVIAVDSIADKLKIKTEFVGKSAKYILSKLGIEVDSSIKVIIMETNKDHPFVQEELMMPILPIVRVKDVDEAIDLAVEVEHGNRHTAMMHSKNVDKLTKMARLIQTTIFVKNGPSYSGIGVGGEGHTTFTIAGPTGEGLTSAKTFTRKRRCVLVEGFNVR